MKIKITLSSLAIFTMLNACNNADSSRSGKDSIQIKDSIQKPDTGNKTDFHTTGFDVIENLFIFINSKEWITANKFYADSLDAKRNSSFFKELFISEGIQRLDIDTLSKSGTGIFVKAKPVKRAIQSNELCFLFEVSNDNLITKQSIIPCQ